MKKKLKKIKLENLSVTPRFVLFMLSLLYLYAELVFNVLMLDAAGTSMTTPREIEDIQYFGRMISAFGFTLLVLGMFVKNGFVLQTPTDWKLAWGTVLLCSFPLFMTYGEIIFGTLTGYRISDAAISKEMHWAFVTLGGCIIFLTTRGSNPFFTILGIVMMAWPAMFSGQKLMVERYVVSPTSWEDRLTARYMLMARSSAEDCMIQIGELDLCHAAIKNDELRSVNAVLATFMIFSSRDVMKEVNAQKEAVLWNLVMKNAWFGVDEAYMRYLYEVDDVNRAVQHQYNLIMNQYETRRERFKYTLYQQYSDASRRYFRALDTSVTEEVAARSWAQIDRRKQDGWEEYRRVAVNYNLSIAEVARDVRAELTRIHQIARNCRGGHCDRQKRNVYTELMRKYGEYTGKLEEVCGGNILEHPCRLTEAEIAAHLHREKDPEFIAASGFPPDIQTREEFFAQPALRKKLETAVRDAFYEELQKENIPIAKDDIPFFRSQQEIENYLMRKIRGEADRQWSQNVMAALGFFVPPGLEWDAFFKIVDERPEMAQLQVRGEEILEPPPGMRILSRQEFARKYIVPEYEREAVKHFDQIREEAPQYANYARLAEQGKDYVRAVFIPAIALGLSLLIALITVAKNLIFLMSYVFKFFYLLLGGKRIRLKRAENIYHIAAWFVFSVLFTLFVMFSRNAYTENKTYQLYYTRVAEHSKPIAVGLDIVVRVQPTIYGYGKKIVDSLGRIPRG